MRLLAFTATFLLMSLVWCHMPGEYEFTELDWTAETPSNSKILKVADTLFKKRFSNEQPKTAEDIHRIKQSIQKFIIENKAKLEKIYGSMDH